RQPPGARRRAQRALACRRSCRPRPSRRNRSRLGRRSSMKFGLFDFDPDSGALTREGLPVRLQPQPARVLALLSARAGEVVTREGRRQGIGGNERFVVFERGLNFCTAQTRSAPGVSASSPRFVETVPRRGYRFIAPVPPPVPVVEASARDPRLKPRATAAMAA